MDGKGCWRDNVFVERLWRTIKYEHVYLYAYGSMKEAKERLNEYLELSLCVNNSETPDYL